MDSGWIVTGATAVALVAAWILYELADFDVLPVVRTLLRWSARALLTLSLLVPSAATAAFVWVATQEQERINEMIVEPLLEQLTPTTTTP